LIAPASSIWLVESLSRSLPLAVLYRRRLWGNTGDPRNQTNKTCREYKALLFVEFYEQSRKFAVGRPFTQRLFD
jgi:hypothetical protein